MPAVFDKCVKDIMAKGKDKKSAFAICTIQFKKKHGMTPQEAKEKGMSDDDLKQIEIEEYARTFEMPTQVLNTISRKIELEEINEADFEQKKTLDVEVLRSGKFKHPEYGTIVFNDSRFQSFIKNFNEGVPQEHVAYDFKHRPDWGAAAWIKKLFTSGSKLFATVELTRRGYTSLKNKEFIYFSTEYHDNYPCRETGKKFGPTILGGGLTNRPFIKGMAPIMLSEEGEEIFSPVPKAKKGVTKKLSTTKQKGDDTMLKTLKEYLDALKAKITELSGDEATVEKGDLEEMQTFVTKLGEGLEGIKPDDLKDEKDTEKLSEIVEQVKSLGERIGKIKVHDKNAEGKLEKLGKRVDTFEKKFSSIDLDEGKVLAEENRALKAELKKLSEGNESLGEAVKKLQEKNESTDKKLYDSSVKSFAKELEEDGFWPGTCKEVSAILSAYDGKGSAVVSLSEEEGEGDDKKTVEHKLSLQDVIRRVLSSVPAESRIDLSEKTKGPSGDTKKKKLSVADIEKIATERKLSYAQAVIELSQDPEYKDQLDIM